MSVLGRFFAGSAGAGPFSRRARAGLALKVTLSVWSMLLLVAALLKSYSLYWYGETLFGSRVLAVLVIVVELISAGAIVLDPKIARARVLGMILFGGFAVAALVEGVQGRASCGCFGPLAVSPWYTLALDLTAVAVLVALVPGMCGMAGSDHCDRLGAGTLRVWFPVPGARSVVLGVLLLLTALAVTRGVISGLSSESMVILEPREWVGQRLPILESVATVEELNNGWWLLVFHRHGCPSCQEIVQELEAATEDVRSCDDGAECWEAWQESIDGRHILTRIALIELPPFGNTENVKPVPYLVSTRAHGGVASQILAPMVIELSDGCVVSLAVGEECDATIRDLVVRSLRRGTKQVGCWANATVCDKTDWWTHSDAAP